MHEETEPPVDVEVERLAEVEPALLYLLPAYTTAQTTPRERRDG